MNIEKKTIENIYNRIGLRLSVYSAIVSLFFAMLTLFALLYMDYGIEKRQMAVDVERMIDTVETQLSKNLWDIDTEAINVTRNSLSHLPFIAGIKITCYAEGDFFAGEFQGVENTTRPLIYQGEALGTLRIKYNHKYITDAIYKKYQNLGIVILFIVGSMGFIFYTTINHASIRHMRFISRSLKMNLIKEDTTYRPLKLHRRRGHDELSHLVDVLNQSSKQAIELIEAKQERQQQIEYQANYDLLTVLPNRRHLYEYLEQQIKNYTDDKGSLIIMFIDLDGFKQVNDSMGHDIGDGVLRACSKIIAEVTDRFKGYVSRLGGDEFIMIFYTHETSLYQQAAKDIINTFDNKISFDGIHVKLGCSIGITSFPNKQLTTPKSLIRSADSALYRAKSSGKNTFFLFNEEILQKMSFAKAVKEKLIQSIDNDMFEVYFQPLLDIDNYKVIGFEALLRWHDEELGQISPETFIAIAEKSGDIFNLDILAFEKAYQKVKQWRKIFNEPFILSVNFSPGNFYHGNFISWIENSPIFNTENLDWIEFEITERLMLNDDPVVLEGINHLKEKGISFSVDDFGVGYSSLGSIKHFIHLLSKIKVDRIFVSELEGKKFDLAFIKSIMMLAEIIDLKVLAEGIERREQVTMLKSVGCQYVQGYYFSPPLPSEEIQQLLSSYPSVKVVQA